MPFQPLPMIGKVFGRLTVIERQGTHRNGNPLWLCECACGRRIVTTGSRLRDGDRKACSRANHPTRYTGGHPVPVALLRELLDCDPATGILTWQSRPAPVGTFWNARYAGKRAGSLRRSQGRCVVNICGRRYQAGVVVWALCTGAWPRAEIDHIDRVPSDNRLSNLRPATHRQNMANRKLHRNNRLGIMGVYFYRRTRKFRAAICVNGRSVHLGYFPTSHEAAAAYQAAARANRGEFAV
ncbi:MAG: HNH endonuclease [Alphaproteobacteria bacterium]|nr:HNH endonuclease [Alphaproteobacteria bacterium]